jgi:hypothetical protein
MSTNHYDMIIVATGAGGGTLADRLASTGARFCGSSAETTWAANRTTGVRVRSTSRRNTTRRRPTRASRCIFTPTITSAVGNLSAVEASFFPSSGAVNPALTIVANALRVGDHLIDRFGLKAQAREAVAQ